MFEPDKLTEKKQVLQFNIAQLLKEYAGAARSYVVENAAVPDLDEDIVLLAPIAGQIRLARAGNDILASVALSTEVEMPCSRCLAPVPAPVTIDFEETFYPTRDIVSGAKLELAPDADPATLISETNILDLTEVVRQELYLSQPTHVLCREDCQGLCPQCGQNKNESTCTCQDNPIDARWADLLALK